jgi:hypothetical protein
MHSRVPPLLILWTLIAACAGGEDSPGSGSGGGDSPDAAPSAGASPAQSQPSRRGTVPMQIVLKLDGKTYESAGMGECASSADASIYQTPATMWHAIYQGAEGADPQHLNLTVWRPRAGGGDMVGLAVAIGEADHEISTVRGGTEQGSGTAGVQPAARGGTLTVAGKDDHGHAVDLSVQCERFDEVVAEGG